MTEEFPDYNSFYIFPKDHRNQAAENVIGKCYETKTPATRIDQRHIYARRQFEREKFTQKSLPSLHPSYGSIYAKKSSESDPLLNRPYHFTGHLYGEPVPVTRYRRTQIFLFFYIVFYLGYLIIGSICFQKLEFTAEQDVRSEFRDYRRKFLEKNPSVEG